MVIASLGTESEIVPKSRVYINYTYIYIYMTIFQKYSVIQAGYVTFNSISKMHALFS